MDELTDLQNWYLAQCDGEWEHDRGVSITSCDNPGWWIKVDLRGTRVENASFQLIQEGDPDPVDPKGDWLRCYIENQVFNGAGDPQKLQRILRIFLNWAKQSEPSN